MKLFGAAGVGFGLFLSPDYSSAEELRRIIRTEFENDRARIIELFLNKEGLVVTVS